MTKKISKLYKSKVKLKIQENLHAGKGIEMIQTLTLTLNLRSKV